MAAGGRTTDHRRGKSARIAERQTVRPAKGVVVPETGAADKGDEA
jgi:large subunit ribosomal protein L19